MKRRFDARSLRNRRMLLLLLGGLLLVSLLVWGFLAGRNEAATEREREKPIAAPSRVSTQNGEAVVSVDAATRARSGLQVAPLASAAGAASELRAYGSVVDLQQLTELYTRYTDAQAQVEKAWAALDASRREYERLRVLYEDNQNASTKALQAAEATMRADQANAEAAAAPLRSLAATARQDWGPTLAEWMLRGSPEFRRLLARQQVLVQVTLPPDVYLDFPPAVAPLQAGNGPRVPARLVSVAARTDPRIQGQSFFYLAPASGGILPGMSVAAYLPRPGGTGGARVQASAVVWWQGRAWIYVEIAPGRYTRRRVPTETPASDGGYVVNTLPPGARVVVQGAQLLLSEELRSQIQVGGEG